MAITDLIARSGDAFQSSFLRAQANRRAQETHGLRQQMLQQNIAQNEQQMEQQKQRRQALTDYKGDRRGLVDTLLRNNDLEGAAGVADLYTKIERMDTASQKAANERIERMQSESIANAGSILEAFKRDPGQGMALYQQLQQNPESNMPPVRTPDEAIQWAQNSYNRSLTARAFEEKRRHQKAMETGKAGGSKGKQKLNLHWPGLDRPVKGVFNPDMGAYLYEESPGKWVNAPPEAQVVTTGIQGTSKDVLGLTKTNITELNRQLQNDETAIGSIKNIIEGVERAPGAVGVRGAVGEIAAGLTGQFGVVGEDISRMIESDDEAQVRAGIRMLTGVLIPRVTGDTSGRYSDRDMERVDAINRGLKPTSSKRQTINALKVVLDVYEKGNEKTKAMLGGQEPIVPTTGASKYSGLWGDD